MINSSRFNLGIVCLGLLLLSNTAHADTPDAAAADFVPQAESVSALPAALEVPQISTPDSLTPEQPKTAAENPHEDLSSSRESPYVLTEDDRIMLEQIEKDTLQYFVRMSDKVTGLTRDSSRTGSPASVAATGFALAAFAIGADRGWIDADYARKRIHLTLQTLLNKADHKNGFFYHFLDTRTAKRVWGSEASSIDTALLVAGALLSAQYYPHSDIESMAHKIYERVDWPWMMNGSDLICMGWTPEEGFLPYYWDSYNELIILQALALGSPKRPIPREAWDSWLRREDEFNGRKIVHSYSGSLFTYQYAQAFIDFRRLNDKGINYFQNSREASLANFEYSLSHQHQYKGYGENSWGLSASVGPGGYKAYGSKPGEGLHDGTIAPYAAIGSIVFTPKESVEAIRHYYQDFGSKIYGLFGFKGAFNVDKNWWSDEYLGIDQGVSVLMLENFLNRQKVWKKFMELEAIQNWIHRCDLKS